MNEIITWAAQHNTLVIQVVFSIILLLILIYVYRLFFVNSGSAGSIEASAELGELNQKLTQLLEVQKSGGQVIEKVVATAAVGALTSDATSTPTMGDGSTEIEQLKNENAKLKTQLNESEKKVFELTPIAGPEDSLKEDGPKADSAKVTELNKKIDELQSRLSEYDIIADDIAELSQLRAENADLKKQVQGGGAAVTASAPEANPTPEPVAEVKVSAPDPLVEAVVSESTATDPLELPNIEIPESTPEASPEPAPVTELAGGVPGFDAETSALLDSLVAETDAVSGKAEENTEPVLAMAPEPAGESLAEDPQAKIVMDQNIPETEKNLINEFEKSIQKGS